MRGFRLGFCATTPSSFGELSWMLPQQLLLPPLLLLLPRVLDGTFCEALVEVGGRASEMASLAEPGCVLRPLTCRALLLPSQPCRLHASARQPENCLRQRLTVHGMH